MNQIRPGASVGNPHFTEDISGTADGREFAVFLDDTGLALKKIENPVVSAACGRNQFTPNEFVPTAQNQ